MIHIIQHCEPGFNKDFPNTGTVVLQIDPCARTIQCKNSENSIYTPLKYFLSFPYIIVVVKYSLKGFSIFTKYEINNFYFGFAFQDYKTNPKVYPSDMPNVSGGFQLCFGDKKPQRKKENLIKDAVARFFSNSFYQEPHNHPILYSLADWEQATLINKNFIMNVDWERFSVWKDHYLDLSQIKEAAASKRLLMYKLKFLERHPIGLKLNFDSCKRADISKYIASSKGYGKFPVRNDVLKEIMTIDPLRKLYQKD